MKKFFILITFFILTSTDAFAANAAQQQVDSRLAETMDRVVTGGGGGGGTVTNTTVGSTTSSTTSNNINLCNKITCPAGMYCSDGCCSFTK